MTALYVMWQLAGAAIGASFGSLAALASIRLAADRSLWSPPSHCPVCHSGVRWHDNVPVVGWLVLQGRCRDCGTSISPFYPLVEAGFACLGWLLFRRFVPGPHALDLAHLAAFGVYLVFAWMLMVAAYSDLRSRIIPELVSLWAVPVGIAACAGLEALGYDGWMAVGWRGSVVGVAVGALPMFLLSWVWERVSGREGLGHGDVRMIGMIGAFVGALPGLLVVLVLASFGGAAVGIVWAAVRGRSGYLPFGPWLTFGALAYVLYGDLLVARALPSLAPFLPL